MIDLSVNITPPIQDRIRLKEAWLRAGERVCSLPGAGLYHQNGTDEVRAAIVTWLADIGVSAAPDELLLCSGAQQGLQIALGLCAGRSNLIASEAAVYSGARAAAQHHGLEWLAVAHDDQGMLPDALDGVLANTPCRTVFTIPVCHNPLGFEIGEARRRDIVDVCRRREAALIEDDVYGIYAASPRTTFRQLAPERTWYVNSFSKSLTPLVRLGVLVPPPHLYSSAMHAIRAQIYGTAPIAWALAGALIESGAAASAADCLRSEAAARMDLVACKLPQARLPMPGGATHVWLPLPFEAARATVDEAQSSGVSILQTEPAAPCSMPVDGIRLSIMTPLERGELELALGRLAEILAAHT